MLIPWNQSLPELPEPADRGMAGATADLLSRVQRATVVSFDRAGVTVAFAEDEAAFALLALWGANPVDMDEDVADMLVEAAESSFRRVRDGIYAALDAAAGDS